LLLGPAGAVVGGGLGLTPKIQIPFKMASAYLNRDKAVAPINEPTKTPGMTSEGYPASEFTPSGQQASTSGQERAKQTRSERVVRGGIDEETGATGRERQTGYNTRTAQEAARVAGQQKILKSVGLNPDKPLAEFPDVSSTKHGFIVSQEEKDRMDAENKRKQEILEHNQELQNRERQRKIQKVGSEWQQLASKAEEMAKSPDASIRSRAQSVMNEAIRMWHEGSPSLRTPQAFGSAVGAGLGFSAPYALDKYQEGDTQGALSTLGVGAGLGTALTTVPRRAVPAVNLGLSSSDAYNRATRGDVVGSATSALGAVAPYVAPMMLGPEVGIPAGIATAVGAPIANYVKDKYFPYKSALETTQPTQ